ncbi:MAG: hypothetical protein OXE95_10615 [Chloroflexi bacterium]|nr:hypothetical protein [Chloroflexota bacterium]MCY4248010.1 hypothetical protein [Chloroflexota bacterium]
MTNLPNFVMIVTCGDAIIGAGSRQCKPSIALRKGFSIATGLGTIT